MFTMKMTIPDDAPGGIEEIKSQDGGTELKDYDVSSKGHSTSKLIHERQEYDQCEIQTYEERK